MKKYSAIFLKWLLTSGMTALASGVVASIGTLVVSDIQDQRSKARDLQNEAISKLREKQYDSFISFASEDDGLLDASKGYINAILKRKSLAKPAEELADQVKKQVISADKLKVLFAGADVEERITAYQKALLAFSASIEGFKSEATASEWSEKFEKVINSKMELRASLRKAIGRGA